MSALAEQEAALRDLERGIIAALCGIILVLALLVWRLPL